MHIDLYAANEDVTDATQDLLDLLYEEEVQAQPSIVAGGVICHINTRTFPAFMQAVQHWNAQQSGRHANPNEVTILELQGKDTSLTITVHPTQAAAAAS